MLNSSMFRGKAPAGLARLRARAGHDHLVLPGRGQHVVPWAAISRAENDEVWWVELPKNAGNWTPEISNNHGSGWIQVNKRHRNMVNITIFKIGKSTISMAIFNSCCIFAVSGRWDQRWPPLGARPLRSCLGFVKAMLCDQLFGQHQNLFVVAAANPYREEGREDWNIMGELYEWGYIYIHIIYITIYRRVSPQTMGFNIKMV
jgi:hypothetical protein